jgi:hypothetical protein
MARPPQRESAAGLTGTLAAVVLLLALVMGYILAYFLLTRFRATFPDVPLGSHEVRFYRYEWQASIFRPAAIVESALTRRDVSTDDMTALVEE